MTSVNQVTPNAENNGTGGAPRSIAYCLEDLTLGLAATFTKTVTDADVVAFAQVSGDTNPIHLDEAYAAKTVFKSRIAHGILTAAYISATLATRLPGAGAVYVSQNLKFKAPVRIGDTVTARVEVIGIVLEKKFVTFKTQCLVGDKVVLDGEATLMVPSRASA
ncbi:MAG: MaoC family dehydratase [Rhodospirillaceae bacterium]|nr:MAG: MaoC family dehydratase [Rhodospirillaceae bacterium]